MHVHIHKYACIYICTYTQVHVYMLLTYTSYIAEKIKSDEKNGKNVHWQHFYYRLFSGIFLWTASRWNLVLNWTCTLKFINLLGGSSILGPFYWYVSMPSALNNKNSNRIEFWMYLRFLLPVQNTHFPHSPYIPKDTRNIPLKSIIADLF